MVLFLTTGVAYGIGASTGVCQWLSAAGQYKIHTVKDYLDLAEFANGCRLAVVLATLEG
jgi:hypothetical protein